MNRNSLSKKVHVMGGFFENKNVRDAKISEHLIGEGEGSPIPDSRVDRNLTNLGFNELPPFNESKPFPHGNR